MDPTSIRIYLPEGRPDGLRTAEISNWTGKAIACPRSTIDQLFKREEARSPGVYLLLGQDFETDLPSVYIGEAEVVSKRLKSHSDKDFWVKVIVFVSKDENLTKAHGRFLEGALIDQAVAAGKAVVLNSQTSGAKLPESDEADMTVFLRKMLQLMPILGTNVFEIASKEVRSKGSRPLQCTIKGLVAKGNRTSNGFIIYKGSKAVGPHRKSATHTKKKREDLIQRGILVQEKDHYMFSQDFEFPSASAAASVVRGGSSSGLLKWKDRSGKTLKEIESTENT